MPKYTEESMQQALVAIRAGDSIHRAAELYGVPRSTLQGRVHGSVTREQANSDQQALSKEQESHLVTWATVQAKLGLPPTYLQVRQAAQRILRAAGSEKKLGKNWITEFIRRNHSIKAVKGMHIKKARIEAITPDKIKEFFEILSQDPIIGVRPANRYNMDETGIMEGMRTAQKVIAPSSTKKVWIKQQKRNTWTTIIECVSAEGNYLPPVVIWQGKSVQQQWFPDDLIQYENWKFAASENGYSDNDIGLGWLLEVFLPRTQCARSDWRLLVIDGHKTHATDEFMLQCLENKVWVAWLPAHSSHATQPLDVGVFSFLKRRYRAHTDELALLTNADDLAKEDFLECYGRARSEALTIRNGRAGWKATGLWPVDVKKVLEYLTVATGAPEPPAPSHPPQITTPMKDLPPILLQTPQGGADVRKRADILRKRSRPTHRVFIHKLMKALDMKNTRIADLEYKVRSLEQVIKRLRPKKRARVEVNPNKRFVELPQVKAAQAKARAAQRHTNDLGAIEFDGFQGFSD